MELVPFNRKNDQVHWSHPRPPEPEKYETGTPQQEKMTKYTGFEDERQGQGLRCCGWGTF